MSLGLSQSQVYSALNNILKPENPQRGSVTCVGYAPSKGRRCQWAINAGNRAAFAQKLYELAGTDLKDISGYLYDLASLGLCLRYHQSQASQVAAQWSRQINSWLGEQSTIRATHYRSERTSAYSRSDAIRAGTTGASDAQVPARTAFRMHQNNQNTARREEVIEIVERTSGLHSSTRDRVRPQVVQPSQATPSSPRPPQTSTFSNPPPAPRVEPIFSTSQPSLRSVLEDIPPVPRTEPTSSPGSSSRADLANLPSPPSSEFTFTAGRRLASLEQASTSDANPQPIPNLPYVFATNFSAVTTLPAPTTQNQRTPPPTVVAPSPPTVPVQATPLPAAAAPTISSTVTATPPATEEIQCTASHAERKSLEDDCPICQEPLALTPLADLTWCKAQCGTNFHRECWAEWESSQLGSTSTGLPTLRCAFCRTSWPTPCHHDTSTPPAAPIQPEPAADDDDDDEDDTFFPPSFFDPRSHAWSLWSTPASATTTNSSSSSSPDHSSPLAALFDPARHARPLLRDRRARADVFFALPATAEDDDDDDGDGDGSGSREEGDGLQDDIAAALAALFNPRVHRRAQVFCGWEAEAEDEEEGGRGGTGFEVLFDAKRHGRALRSERLARAAVLDGQDGGDDGEGGGVLGALFEEEVREAEEEEKQQQSENGRGLQMVYVTLVDDPGKEEEREGGEEDEQEEPKGLCERVAWWVCGRKWL